MTTPATWDDALDTVLAEMRALMVARQAKYGPQNVRDQGLYGVITRAVADKVARILRALNGRVVNGRVELDPITDAEAQDTFEDGLFDAANYLGPIALMVYRGWWDLPRKAVTDVTVATVQAPSDCEDMVSPDRVTVPTVTSLLTASRFPQSAPASASNSAEPRGRCSGYVTRRCGKDYGHLGAHAA